MREKTREQLAEQATQFWNHASAAVTCAVRTLLLIGRCLCQGADSWLASADRWVAEDRRKMQPQSEKVAVLPAKAVQG